MMQNKATHGKFGLYLAGAAGIFMTVSQYMIFAYAPEERVMGIIQKIFYLHLPLAWWALCSFFLVFLGSIFYLLKPSAFWDALNEAAAETGLLMAMLSLLTGSIWARFSWNTWWSWDPRLSTTLILCFIYAAWLLIRRTLAHAERRGTISAVLGILAFLDVPLVFFSTRLWPQTLHPDLIGKSDSLSGSMLVTLGFSLAGIGLFWVSLLCLRYRLGRMEQRLLRQQIKRTVYDG
ncbi:MAG: cytochrome c biogenesis protein CcsA [Deltaproteobacteria bacterium]|jgi:heme exporter protein C|nr:cytochrome c biogenesis protein CcsA [Deltaproteobacteria bacterium]